MDYEKLLANLSEAELEGLEQLFVTESKPRFGDDYQRPPSYYGGYKDASSIGYREPSDRPGQGYKLQGRSGKTFFTNEKAAKAVQSWVSDPHIGTTVVPELGEDGKLKSIVVQVTEDNPKRGLKAGQIVSRVPATTQPTKGMHPLELIGVDEKGKWESPRGYPIEGKSANYHIGSPVADVTPYKKLAGKAGLAASLVGAVTAAKAGDYGTAVDLATNLFVPPFAESRGLNENEAEELAKRRDMLPTITKAKGGAIKMPDSYSNGRWRLI